MYGVVSKSGLNHSFALSGRHPNGFAKRKGDLLFSHVYRHVSPRANAQYLVMVQARSSLRRAVFFLTAIDGGMIRSFVRQQNRTVSVGFRPRKWTPGKRLVKRSFFEMPWRHRWRYEISGLNWRNRPATTSLISKRLPKSD